MGLRAKTRSGLAVSLAAISLAACTPGEPFVLTDYRSHQNGVVEVCYDDKGTSMAAAQKLADDICGHYERTASYQMSQSYQCNWTTPAIALFYCVARPGETPPPFVPQKSPVHHSAPAS